MRIHDCTVISWPDTITGDTAIAAGHDRVALYGGYGPNRDRLVTGQLSAAGLRVTGYYRVTLPDGTPVPDRTTVTGRGPRLHFLTPAAGTSSPSPASASPPTSRT